MNNDWHSKYSFTNKNTHGVPMRVWDVAENWRREKSQFDYFSNPENGYINGNVLSITKNEIANTANNMDIQKGDILFFQHEGENEPYHAAIITGVENGEIKYSAHTNSRNDAPLSEYIKNDTVLIIRINDNAK
jgi:cell wall-associated NlpC family hydrolase